MIELAKKLIVKHEGLQLKAYVCPAGYLTIGYGRNLQTNGISKEEAECLLKNDLVNIKLSLVDEIDFFIDLDEVRQAVLVDMAYQLGVKGLLSFRKFLGYLKIKDYLKASYEMLDSKWATQTPTRAQELSQIIKKGGF